MISACRRGGGRSHEFLFHQHLHDGLAEWGGLGRAPPSAPALWGCSRGAGPGGRRYDRPEFLCRRGPHRGRPQTGHSSTPLWRPPRSRSAPSGHAVPAVPTLRPNGYQERGVLRCPAAGRRRAYGGWKWGRWRWGWLPSKLAE